jgi:hypothetical protein
VATGRDRADRLTRVEVALGDGREMAAGRSRSEPRPFWRVLASTGTATSASGWLSSRSWAAQRRARLDQRTGEAERPPGRPHRTALAIALTSGSISRGERPPPCRPRAKLEKLVRDRRGGSSAAVPGPALSEFNDPTAETVASSPNQHSCRGLARVLVCMKSSTGVCCAPGCDTPDAWATECVGRSAESSRRASCAALRYNRRVS